MAKVKIELSLREARALLRAVAASSRLVYDPRAPFGAENQSESYRVLVNVESAVGSALGEFANERFGDYGSGYALRYRWADEPLAAPFGSVLRKAVA